MQEEGTQALPTSLRLTDKVNMLDYNELQSQQEKLDRQWIFYFRFWMVFLPSIIVFLFVFEMFICD